jgi:hypothetical protein
MPSEGLSQTLAYRMSMLCDSHEYVTVIAGSARSSVTLCISLVTQTCRKGVEVCHFNPCMYLDGLRQAVPSLPDRCQQCGPSAHLELQHRPGPTGCGVPDADPTSVGPPGLDTVVARSAVRGLAPPDVALTTAHGDLPSARGGSPRHPPASRVTARSTEPHGQGLRAPSRTARSAPDR